VSQAEIGAGIVGQAALRARQQSTGRLGKEWVGVLGQVPLFEHLSKRHLRRIAGLAVTRRYEAGTSIIRAGDRGDAFYVILDGKARARPRTGRSVTLGAGDFFGEMALLDGAPRSADVDAVTEVLTIRLGRPAFSKLLKQESQIAATLLVTLADRVRRLEQKTAGTRGRSI
jgi:CRP-like cAMP-binding protein